MSNITLSQIETFLTVAEHLNFSEAAKTLFISQPALSKAIGRLEDSISTKLFVRSSHGVRLTTEGEYLYRELSPPLNRIHKVLQTARDMDTAKQRTLRIGCHTSYEGGEAYGALRQIVREYERRNPDVIVLEELYEFNELRTKLHMGELDLVITTTFALEEAPGISRRVTNRMGVYLAMSSAHPLAKSDSINPARSSEEVFYFIESTDSGSHTNNELARCRQLGITPKKIIYLPNFSSVIMAVRKERGMTLCGRYRTTATIADIKFVEVKEDLPDQPYVLLAWRTEDISREGQTFIALVDEFLTSSNQ
jgi:DNA-binding transcriptional LysR family regulator